MAVSSRIRFLLLLPSYGGCRSRCPEFLYASGRKPLITTGDSLPDLGMATPTDEGEKHRRNGKSLGEASMTDNGLTTGEQARQFAFGKVRDAVSGR